MNVRPATREFEYWTPDQVFAGETVFCLASGPSLTQEIVDKIRGPRTIVVNTSVNLAPWADVLFFTDSGWYEPRRELVANFAGLVISMSATAKRELPDKVKRVQGIGDPQGGCFPKLGSPGVRQGRSSGHTAVGLAIALGASRVILVGYDMRMVGGREHHHSEYSGPRDLDQYAREFVPAFNGWNEDAHKVGVKILNATPLSAVREFPMVNLEEVLNAV